MKTRGTDMDLLDDYTLEHAVIEAAMDWITLQRRHGDQSYEATFAEGTLSRIATELHRRRSLDV